MARTVHQRFMTSGLLFHLPLLLLLLQLVAIGRVSSRAHPPRSAGAVRIHWDTEPWHRIDSEGDVDVAESSVDWSADGGFGRRLSIIQRRNGATVPPEAPQLIVEASTKLVGVTRQLRPKIEKDVSGLSVRPESSTPRLIRTRLPSSNRTNGATNNVTEIVESTASIVAPNASLLNETVQPLLLLDSIQDSISPPAVPATEPTVERVTEQVVIESSSNPIVSVVATETRTLPSTTTSASPPDDGQTSDLSTGQGVAIAPETATTVRSTTTTTSSSTAVPSTTATTVNSTGVKPLWRIRMEQNLSNRRQQSIINPTVKLADADISPESEIPATAIEQKPTEEEAVVASVDFLPSITSPVVRPQVVSVSPSVEQVESSVSTVERTPLSTMIFNSPISRPIFSTRVPFSSTLSSQGVRTPLVTARIVVPVSQSSLTRLNPPPPPPPPPPVPRKEDVLETGNNDFNHPQFSSTTAPVLLGAMTTTIEPTTIRKVAPPTPVMHSLEDILQRLVPAKDDSFGHNPFLATGSSNSHGSRNHHRNPSSTSVVNGDDSVNNNNEIVSTMGHQNVQVNGPRAVSGAGSIINWNNSINGNSNSSSTDSNESQSSATSIYIIGVVAIIPLAGAVLWIVRVQLHKRRERLNESETSSETETGFRKTRLPPVALTTSKHARLFYGPSDKEDLVPGGGGSASSNKTSPLGSSAGGNGVVASRHSPWEFKRSNLRLQTLIGEGNFGQVWKAEAEDICGCQGTLLVAVKTVKDGATSKEKQELLREMKIMQQLGPHPNVVALLGCCTEQEPFLLIMEYVMYGRLLTFLREHRTQQTYYNYSSDNEALTSRDLTTFAYCVAKGMEFIYSKGVVHRDLAARNVLVDHNKLCKVADFGLSRSVRDTAGEMYEQRVKGALPIRWMAPESLIQSVFTQKSDVWSFGILIWEIVTLGSTPYPGMEAREVMRRVKDGHRLERPNHCRPEFYRLMSRCWHSDPQRRPDFGELKAELGQLLDDADGYIDLDNFQESIYVPLESPSDESEKV